MGDTLKREFQPGQVVTGPAPDPNMVINNATFGGQVPQPQTRPTFLSAFIQNLPAALAGGAGQPSFSAGVGGALQGIEQQKRYKQQQADEAAQRNFQNQLAQAQEQRLAREQQAQQQYWQGLVNKSPTDTSVTPFEVWRAQNPNAPISDWIKLNQLTSSAQPNELQQWLKENPGKTTSDYLRFKSGLTGSSSGDVRLDRSYNLTTNQLSATRKPIDERADRIGRLVDSLNQNSPQADALIAPELLTAMAGGQGSGLRMNEAEISRIVGGRNNWQSLLSAAQKWQSDPSKPFLITPAQRQQVRDLITVIQQKVAAKQTVLDDAQGKLISAGTVEEHRKILADTRKQLTAIDQKDFSLPDGNGQMLDEATAQKFLNSAGGDPAKARILAAQHGWKM